MVLTASVKGDSKEAIRRLALLRASRRAINYSERLRGELQNEIKTVIRENFVTDRPTRRRRAPGSPRLINSFEVVVSSGGRGARDAGGRFAPQFPVVVTARVKPRVQANDEAMAKILSLTRGSRAHPIVASEEAEYLRFPWSRTRGPHAMGSAARRRHAYGKPNVKIQAVMHPGIQEPVDILGLAAQRVRRRVRL